MNSESDIEMRNVIALFQLKASLNLGKFETIRAHVQNLDEKSFDFSFYQAISHIHEANFTLAQACIDRYDFKLRAV